ncbi:G-protein coupled receptor 4-like [Pempheris klunzingeri]|uniref:G-protein coupled receptor 4-like n=1 Tax=Pempheris klunzingeri TaxID=3127111 RepID=UPI00397F1797
MEDFNFNSPLQDNNDTNTNSDFERGGFIIYVMTCAIPCVGLPLTLGAIYALYCLVRNGHVVPVYVINLLISDLIQLCWMIAEVTRPLTETDYLFYIYGLLVSVGFMVCIALERYLVIAWPLWYRFRRTIKSSVVVCVMVWAFPLVYLLPSHFWFDFEVIEIIFAVIILVPFPLLIFFLIGTLKALSAADRVASDEKRRIVGILVLVLLIYTLLFLPSVIWFLAQRAKKNFILGGLSFVFLKLSPLADLALYVFVRKGIIDKLLASLCRCRTDSNDISISAV